MVCRCGHDKDAHHLDDDCKFCSGSFCYLEDCPCEVYEEKVEE